MVVKLLTENYLEFLSLIEGCTGSSEPTLAKLPHCWKSHATAHNILVCDGSYLHKRAGVDMIFSRIVICCRCSIHQNISVLMHFYVPVKNFQSYPDKLPFSRIQQRIQCLSHRQDKVSPKSLKLETI